MTRLVSQRKSPEARQPDKDREPITKIDKKSSLPIFEEVKSEKLPREVGFDKQQTDRVPGESNSLEKQGLTDGELSKKINADRAMLYRWRTGGEPKRPSPRYKFVMKDWEFKGDRWYRRHHNTQP